MLNFLKENTKKKHRQTEMSNLARYIIDYSISMDDYKELLIRNYYSYSITEGLLAHHINLVGNDLKSFIDTDKSDRLLKDLELFNFSLDSTFDITTDLHTSIYTESEIIGILYVLEGSMLGGMLLNKNLSKCRHLEPIKEHHFFGINPQDSLERWRIFCKTVQKKTFTDDEKKKALITAQKTFLTFIKFQTIVLN